MDKIKELEEKARTEYKDITTAGKQLLESIFGKDLFLKKNLTDATTWEDIAEIKGIDPVNSLPYPAPKTPHEENVNYYFMLTVVAEIHNEGWKPDWSNGNQAKWYPYFEHKKTSSGFGFSGTYCGHWGTYTTVGSRLCFKDEKTAKLVGNKFESLYSKYLTF